MNIEHRPIFDIEAVVKHYSEKDGVPIRYVCTSAVNTGTIAVDIFYRDTPHPIFGNHYFGLYMNPYAEDATVMITNAEPIEDLDFEMVKVNDQWRYSQHRHDFYTVDDVSVDGGRAYLRMVGNLNHPTTKFRVKNGEFVEIGYDKKE